MKRTPSPTRHNGERGNMESSIERGRMGGIMRAPPRPTRPCPLEHSGGRGAIRGGLSAHRVGRDFSPDPAGQPKHRPGAAGRNRRNRGRPATGRRTPRSSSPSPWPPRCSPSSCSRPYPPRCSPRPPSPSARPQLTLRAANADNARVKSQLADLGPATIVGSPMLILSSIPQVPDGSSRLVTPAARSTIRADRTIGALPFSGGSGR